MNRLRSGPKAVVLIAVTLLVALAWFDLLDQRASAHMMGVMMESLAAFGIAKVLNGAISVLQSVELSIGVASVTVGEALDPLNDLVEMYATLMKLSIGSLVIQNILLEIVSTLFFKVLIAVTGALFALSVLARGLERSVLTFRLFVFAVFLRFAVVLAVGASALVDSYILEQRVVERVQQVDAFSQEIDFTDADSRVSTELRQSLNVDLDRLQVQEQRLLAEIEAHKATMTEQAQRIARQKQAVEAKRQGMDTLSRLWSSDPEYQALNQALTALNIEQSQLVHESTLLQEELADTRTAIAATRDALQGKPDGFMDRLRSIGGNLSAFTSRINQLVDSFDTLMQDLIYIMSAFLFRTLLMPLMFLYGFLRGFRLIWGVDLRTALRRGGEAFRTELQRRA